MSRRLRSISPLPPPGVLSEVPLPVSTRFDDTTDLPCSSKLASQNPYDKYRPTSESPSGKNSVRGRAHSGSSVRSLPALGSRPSRATRELARAFEGGPYAATLVVLLGLIFAVGAAPSAADTPPFSGTLSVTSTGTFSAPLTYSTTGSGTSTSLGPGSAASIPANVFRHQSKLCGLAARRGAHGFRDLRIESRRIVCFVFPTMQRTTTSQIGAAQSAWFSDTRG